MAFTLKVSHPGSFAELYLNSLRGFERRAHEAVGLQRVTADERNSPELLLTIDSRSYGVSYVKPCSVSINLVDAMAQGNHITAGDFGYRAGRDCFRMPEPSVRLCAGLLTFQEDTQCEADLIDLNKRSQVSNLDHLFSLSNVIVDIEAENAMPLEQTGVLGAIYRLLGQGLDDKDTARKLNLAEVNVQTCIASVVHFLKLTNRQDLVLYASSVA